MLVLVAAKRVIEDFAGVAARDLNRAVGRIGINDDDLISPGYGLADFGDVDLFVVDVDLYGNFQGGSGFRGLRNLHKKR